MQQKFITELEDMGKKNIEKNKGNIDTLIVETDQYVLDNEEIEKTVVERTEEQSKLIGSGEKLATLNNLKGKYPIKYQPLQRNISSLLIMYHALHVPNL